jgi:hypothetical protein
VFVIMLLAGFVPLLQVTFITLLEDYLSGLTRCERSGQKLKDHWRDPYQTAYDHLIRVGHKSMTNFSVVTMRWSLVNTFLIV